jgi:hypothetical protein
MDMRRKFDCKSNTLRRQSGHILACGLIAALLTASCSKSTRVDTQAEAEPSASTVESIAGSSPAASAPNIGEDAYAVVGNILADQYYKALMGSRDESTYLLDHAVFPIDVEASELHMISIGNAASADQKFKGKRLLISGRVLSVRPTQDPLDYWVEMDGGVALFERQRDFVSTLVPGRPAVFSCGFDGVKSVGYVLVGCQSLEKEAESFGKLMAMYPDPLGKEAADAVRRLLHAIGPNNPPSGSACRFTVSLSLCRIPQQEPNGGANVIRSEERVQSALAESSPHENETPASEASNAASEADK